MFKRAVAILVTVLVAVFLLPLNCFATETDEIVHFKIDNEINLSATCELNPQYQSSLLTTESNENKIASFEITEILNSTIYATLDIPIGNYNYSVALEGNFDPIQTETQVGYMGFFFGAIESNIPVYVYAIYSSEKENALIVTIGYASNNSNPEFFVFGELTKALGEISTTYLRNYDYDVANTTDNATPFSDYSLKYRGCSNLNKGGYNLGSVSMFSATEMENGEDTVVYGKTVTNTSNARKYLINELGYQDSLLYDVRAFRANFSISSNAKDCYLLPNVYKPLEESESFTIDIPYVTSSGLEFLPFISIKYSISGIEVDDTLKVAGASLPNKISWDFYDNTGWLASKTDGTQSGTLSSKSGLCAYTFFHYGGNISKNTSVTFTVTGGLSYMGQYVLETGMFPASFPVSPVSINRTITVIP